MDFPTYIWLSALVVCITGFFIGKECDTVCICQKDKIHCLEKNSITEIPNFGDTGQIFMKNISEM